MYAWIMGIGSLLFTAAFAWLMYRWRKQPILDLVAMGMGIGMIAFCGAVFIYLGIAGI